MKSADEARIAPVFEAVVDEFPDVAAGSYPAVSPDGGDVVMISFESKDAGQLDRAVTRYRELLGDGRGDSTGGTDVILSVQCDTDKIQ